MREVSQGRAAGDFDANDRTFAISTEDIPLELMAYPLDENIPLEELEEWLEKEKLLARFAHPVGAVCTPQLARFAYLIGAVCTVLNIQLTPPHSFAAAKEKSESEPDEPVLPYPTNLSEALAHPDIRFYQAMTGCYPEPKDWVLAIDYIRQLRVLHPDLDETALAEAGKKYFAEWEARNYQKTNPSWMHWWLSGYIPQRKSRRTSQKRTQSPKPVHEPFQAEPDDQVLPEDTLERLEASRHYLQSKGILPPRTS